MVYIKIMMMDSEVNFLLYNFITLAFPTFNGFGPESFLNPFSSVNFQTKLQQEKEASQTPRTLDDNITFQRKHEPEILSIRRRRGRGRGRGRRRELLIITQLLFECLFGGGGGGGVVSITPFNSSTLHTLLGDE